MFRIILSIIIALMGIAAPFQASSPSAASADDFSTLTFEGCYWLRTQGETTGWFDMNCYVNAGCLQDVCIKGKQGHFHQCYEVEESPNCPTD